MDSPRIHIDMEPTNNSSAITLPASSSFEDIKTAIEKAVALEER